MWKKIILERIPSTSKTLTISKSGIGFSAKFMKSNNLEEKESIIFFSDPENIYKLGFEFLDELGGPGTLSLMKAGRKGTTSGRTVKATELISKMRILQEIQKNPIKQNRTFEIKNKKEDPAIFYIDLIPCFEFKKKMEHVGDLDDSAKGIYRYKNSGDTIIYIGKGSIKERARSPERREWGINLIEYSIIEDGDKAYEWEDYYLEKYFEEHGAKPSFNIIMGHGKKN
tara:strand:- start:16 stop:696 length:681 start_codon:yes stop_codon:yes gene_type:complete